MDFRRRTDRVAVTTLALIAGAAIGLSASAQNRSPGGADAPALEGPWLKRVPVVRSEYYAIRSDLPAEELRGLAAHLDATFESYRTILGSLRQNLPASFDVLIFAKHDDYLATLRFEFGINAVGSGGMFFSTPAGTALAFFTENQPARRVRHVLQHEGFHQVAFALFGGNLSPWVNEGMAEFFGEAVLVDGAMVIGQTNPRVLDNIRQSIETNTYIPFRQMLNMDGGTWNAAVAGGSARVQYEQAWSMVHFLVYGDNGKYAEAFTRFLRLLNVGHNTYNAFVQAFGTDDVDSFEARWKEFALAAKASSFVTAMERIEFLAAGMLELSRRRVYPTSIDELREQLRAIDFTYTLANHGVTTELKASDDANFLIPADDLTPEGSPGPAFTLVEPSLRGMRARERHLNESNPVPWTLRAENLKPKSLAVRWIRDMEANTFTYDIDVTR